MSDTKIIESIKKLKKRSDIVGKLSELESLILSLKKDNEELRKQLSKKEGPQLVEHKMKVHLSHTQDWSYGIRFNIFKNEVLEYTGKSSPGVIDGIFPKNRIPFVTGIDIIGSTNTLNDAKCGHPRNLSVDRDGNIWAESPYGHRYGGNVRWDCYIDIIIHYSC